jgi:hypothetical protein
MRLLFCVYLFMYSDNRVHLFEILFCAHTRSLDLYLRIYIDPQFYGIYKHRAVQLFSVDCRVILWCSHSVLMSD